MLVVLTVLLLGFVMGLLLRKQKTIIRMADKLSISVILLLLLFLGMSVGYNEGLMADLGGIGLKALALAIAAVLGSVILISFVARKFAIHKSETPKNK